MKSISSFFAAAAAVSALAGATAAPVEAAIKCVGPNQVVQGRLLSTPYCRDTHLAQVANEYGLGVSGHEMRWNPNSKAQVCRTVGHDIRVQEACSGMRPNDTGRRWVP